MQFNPSDCAPIPPKGVLWHCPNPCWDCGFRDRDAVGHFLKEGKHLGHGSFGTVDVVKLRTGPRKGDKYARKLMYYKTRDHKKELRRFQREANVMRANEHPNIVKLVGSFRQTDGFGFLMYPIADSDLKDHLEKIESGEKGKESILPAFESLATTLAFLHERSILHSDIKPDNILVHNHDFLFSDFGLSKDFSDRSRVWTYNAGGTPIYEAWEVRGDKRQRISWPADVYSLAVTFVEMLAVIAGFSASHVRKEVLRRDDRYWERDLVDFIDNKIKPRLSLDSRWASFIDEVVKCLDTNWRLRPTALKLSNAAADVRDAPIDPPKGTVPNKNPGTNIIDASIPNGIMGTAFYAIAKYTFVASGDGQIELREGDQLCVLANPHQGWCQVHNYRTGETGMVPHSYIGIAG